MECTRAYANLYVQHENAVRDLYGMSATCRSFRQELESTQSALHALQQNTSSGVLADRVQGPALGEQGSTEDDLQTKIDDLEHEKAEMEREHERKLANAADHIRDISQKLERFERMNMAPEHSQTSVPQEVTHDRPAPSSRRSRRR
jgi:chromosome segregation ATPase